MSIVAAIWAGILSPKREGQRSNHMVWPTLPTQVPFTCHVREGGGRRLTEGIRLILRNEYPEYMTYYNAIGALHILSSSQKRKKPKAYEFSHLTFQYLGEIWVNVNHCQGHTCQSCHTSSDMWRKTIWVGEQHLPLMTFKIPGNLCSESLAMQT